MRKLPLFLLPALALLFSSSSDLQAQKLTAKENAFFEKSIRPLLAKHCYKCHSKKAGKSKGGLYLDSQAGWMENIVSSTCTLTQPMIWRLVTPFWE